MPKPGKLLEWWGPESIDLLKKAQEESGVGQDAFYITGGVNEKTGWRWQNGKTRPDTKKFTEFCHRWSFPVSMFMPGSQALVRAPAQLPHEQLFREIAVRLPTRIPLEVLSPPGMLVVEVCLEAARQFNIPSLRIDASAWSDIDSVWIGVAAALEIDPPSAYPARFFSNLKAANTLLIIEHVDVLMANALHKPVPRHVLEAVGSWLSAVEVNQAPVIICGVFQIRQLLKLNDVASPRIPQPLGFAEWGHHDHSSWNAWSARELAGRVLSQEQKRALVDGACRTPLALRAGNSASDPNRIELVVKAFHRESADEILALLPLAKRRLFLESLATKNFGPVITEMFNLSGILRSDGKWFNQEWEVFWKRHVDASRGSYKNL